MLTFKIKYKILVLQYNEKFCFVGCIRILPLRGTWQFFLPLIDIGFGCSMIYKGFSSGTSYIN